MTGLTAKPKKCRVCGTTKDGRFDPLSRKECRECKAGRKAERVRNRTSVTRRTKDRPNDQSGKNPEYLAWIRTLPCSVHLCGDRNVQAHHVRAGGAGGTGMKPRDNRTVPLCSHHHREGHDHGWKTFEAKYAISLVARAEALAGLSPVLTKKAAEVALGGLESFSLSKVP